MKGRKLAWLAVLATAGAAAPALAAGTAPIAVFDWFEYRGSDPVDATLDPGPDDYRNPILQGLGVIDKPLGWLSDSDLALGSVIAVNVPRAGLEPAAPALGKRCSIR